MSYNLSRRVKRNQFNLSEANSLSMRMGDLVPVYVRHLIPGDTIDIKQHISARFAPMQAPIMSQVDIKTWTFAVPYRLVWDESQEFFTGKTKNNDPISPAFPRVRYASLPSNPETVLQFHDTPELTYADRAGVYVKENKELFGPHSLADYLDLCYTLPYRAEQTDDEYYATFRNQRQHSMLEPRAYQLIFNEYFRDQNVDDAVSFGTDSFIYDFDSYRACNEFLELMTIRRKRWDKDVFTSALPSPTMTDDVMIPGAIGYDDSVPYLGDRVFSESGRVNGELTAVDGRLLVGDNMASIDNTDNIIIQGNTIRELTRAQMVYQYLLDIARGGPVRYKEWVKTLFNVDTPDARLQRPEYIGGGSQPVIVSDVVQTSETGDTPQGNLSGRAVSKGSHYSSYTAKEHMIIMTIMCVTPKAQYAQGLPKRHFMFDKFDHFIPQFDHIGDEEIKTMEINNNPAMGGTYLEKTFGYAPRYYDYKSSLDRVHGEFKNTLAFWNFTRIFDVVPTLSPEFLRQDTETLERPFYVQSSYQQEGGVINEYKPEQVYVNVYSDVTAWRPMSKLSEPIV